MKSGHHFDSVRLEMRFAFIIWLTTLLFFQPSVNVFASGNNHGDNSLIEPQQIKITGIITDAATGEALVGVNVVVEGTTTGTMTDINGKYSLGVTDLNGTLQISYIGYIAQKIPINGMTIIDLALSADVQVLEEVVVTGYGTVKKSDLTGSVSSIKAEQIKQLPTQRVDQAIQGRATGVFILNTDGSPGGNTMIRIRGNNSINGSNEPLIIVDGLQGASLNQLNPNDISSLEILKDASATAIYGSHGANGVIQNWEKQGNRLSMQVTISAFRILHVSFPL